MSTNSSSIRARSTATSKSSTATSDSAMSTAQNLQNYGSTSTGIFSIMPADEPSATTTSSTSASSSSTAKQASAKKGPVSKTCTLEETPLWMHDNPDILTGYRRETFSYKKCIESLWFLHNETGSFYPAIYYGFYCFQTFQIVYIAMITIIGAAVVVVVVRPEFRGHEYRWIRSCMFLAMGLSAVFPVLHAVVLYGIPLAQKAIAFNYMVCMGASYVIGTLLYGSRTPEHLFPGKFDYFGSSHQIFHVCVLAGVLFHFLGITKAMAFWHDTNHSCAIPISEMRLVY
ncbi:hypothetical protein BGZ79_002718 [Entomortierella chlamydospora]|nr:hypothetical protein BGZ79_002718 [Entomortierella chlamydospora]